MAIRKTAEEELPAIHKLAKTAVPAEFDALKAEIEALKADLSKLAAAVQELASDFDEGRIKR